MRAWQTGRSIVIGGAIITAATFILAAPLSPGPDALELAVGDVASVDITAPRSVTYVSQIQSEAARSAAAASVSDV